MHSCRKIRTLDAAQPAMIEDTLHGGLERMRHRVRVELDDHGSGVHTGLSHLNPRENQMRTHVGAEEELAEALEEQWRRAERVLEEVLAESSRGIGEELKRR